MSFISVFFETGKLVLGLIIPFIIVAWLIVGAPLPWDKKTGDTHTPSFPMEKLK